MPGAGFINYTSAISSIGNHTSSSDSVRLAAQAVESHAICSAIEQLSTPFTIVLGPKVFIGALDIEYMLEALITTGGDTISNYYTDDHSLIGFRHRHVPSTKSHYYNELFRSADLYDLLKTSFT